jgi:hypothetical protein
MTCACRTVHDKNTGSAALIWVMTHVLTHHASVHVHIACAGQVRCTCHAEVTMQAATAAAAQLVAQCAFAYNGLQEPCAGTSAEGATHMLLAAQLATSRAP